jgi:hypothetical protein
MEGMQRLWISLPLAALATLWLTSSALAGGYAITTLDPVPHGMQAGQTYRIGYMIRQHGVSPVRDATPTIIIIRVGERLSFAGMADGAPGHYASDITFPTDGEWTWSVDQSPFPMPQMLGSIMVAPLVAQPALTTAVEPDPIVVPVEVAQPAPVPVDIPITLAVKAQPPAELALLGLVALAAAGVGVALRQVRRVRSSSTAPVYSTGRETPWVETRRARPA